jgi:type IV pilus assembly protein PilQ
MRRRLLGLAAMAVVPLWGIACSSSQSNAVKSDDAAPVASAPAPATPAPAGAVIESAAFGQDSDGARLVLNSDSPLLYTSYEPRPDTLVIDLAGARTSEGFTAPAVGGDLVSSVRVEPMTELGRVQTRLQITHRPGIKYEIASQGRSLAIGFEDAQAQKAQETSAPTVMATEISTQPQAVPPAVPVKTAASAPASAPRGESARTLERIEVAGSGTGATVVLIGDGAFNPNDFVLANPPRLVLDIPGVRSEIKAKVIHGAGPVLRARVSQFRTSPDKVARVVVDLDQARPYALERDGERLVVRVGDAVSAAQAPAPSAAASSAPSRTVLPEQKVEPAPAVKEDTERTIESPKPAEPVASGSSAKSEAPKSDVRAEELAATATAPSETVIPPGRRAKGVLEARRSTRPVAKAAPAKSERDVLFESAEAMLAQQEGGGDHQELANTFKSKTVGGGESQYTGEPISLDLKDADIKDVFRTISELTGLNIVIDPDVKGTVTVRLENVPWDQALELILKQNGLGYILENNVMRIATTAKLQQEETQRGELEKARQGSLPTKTVIKKLSYADADQAATTIKKVMSPRGDVIVDKRTNTLIIKEIQDYMPTVIQLIENLDTPTPQVVIESRIIETTKTFGRSLGINWGFTGVADAAHGNTTNLVFPNNGSAVGTVGLATASPNSLSLVLGNVLNSFNLDAVLTAAENQGLVKIISSPKVSAMTNERAFVQTGLQIPVQTVVNNTTTVIYIDATLRLDVTPQITAEGTILMDVHISKRQPAPGVQIQGGGNVPLSIREAHTKVIVKDGGTAVIGGIFQMNDQDNYNFVPGLWKIPIIGALFKNSVRSDQHDELLIFITPRIVH